MKELVAILLAAATGLLLAWAVVARGIELLRRRGLSADPRSSSKHPTWEEWDLERHRHSQQVSLVEAEYERLNAKYVMLQQHYRRLLASHEKLHREVHQSTALSQPPLSIDPPLQRLMSRATSWDRPPPALNSWANPYENVYHSFFSDQLRPEWESRLRDAGLEIRPATVGLHDRSKTEEAGVYPITADPQGNFYLLTDSRAQFTYVLPAPWVQFNSGNLIQQLEPFYTFADSGLGAIERIPDPARITSIGDPRWRVEHKGQIHFKGSPKALPNHCDSSLGAASQSLPTPPSTDVEAEPPWPNPKHATNGRESSHLDSRKADLWRRPTLSPTAEAVTASAYLRLYNSLDRQEAVEDWEQRLDVGGIDFRRVEVDVREETHRRVDGHSEGTFYILTDSGRKVYYLAPALWVQFNSCNLNQLVPFYEWSDLGSGRIERILRLAQVVYGSWRVERRGMIQFKASTHAASPSSYGLAPQTLPSAPDVVRQNCPLLPSFPPNCPVQAEAVLVPTDFEAEADAQEPVVDPPQPGLQPSVPQLETLAGEKPDASCEIAPPKEVVSVTMAPLSPTPKPDAAVSNPSALLLSTYHNAAVRNGPHRQDHMACEMTLMNAFHELNQALCFTGVTLIDGVHDEILLDKVRRDFALVTVGPDCYLLPLPWLDYVDPDPSRSRALRALFHRDEGKELELIEPAVLVQQSDPIYSVTQKGRVNFYLSSS